MQPVTDPALLAQLNGGGDAPANLTPVTDPTTLAQLNGSLDKTKGPNADVPSYLNPGTAIGGALQDVGSFLQGGANAFLPAAVAKGGVDLTNVPAGIVGGLNQLGEGIGQKAAQIQGSAPQHQFTTQNIRDVQTGLDNLPGADTGAAIGRNALLAAAPANAIGVGLMTAANRAAAPDATGQETLGDTAMSAAGQGLMGAAGAKAIGIIAPKVINALSKGTPALSTSEDFRKLANIQYQKSAEAGGVLKPSVTNNFLDDAASKLAPQTPAGKLLAGDSPAAKVSERLQQLRGKPINLAEAQEIDEYLGDQIDTNSELGRLNKQGKKLLDLQSSLRNSIANATDADIQGGRAGFDSWNQGRQLYRTSMQLRDIEKIVSRADLADNPATAVKSGFRTLANNPERMKGYDKETAGLIRKAATTGIVGDALRVAGSRLIPIFAGAAGHIPGAFGAEAVGLAARSTANKLQLGRAANVTQSILRQGESRLAPTAMAPEATQVEGAITRRPMGSQQGAARSDAIPVLGGGAAGVAGVGYMANQMRNQQSGGGREPNPEGQAAMAAMPPPPIQAPTQPISTTMPMHDELGDFIKALPAAQAVTRTTIASEEGNRPTAYTDKTGHKTVGVGFNMDAPNARQIWKRAGVAEKFDDVYKGTKALSSASSQSLFSSTTAAAEKAAQKLVPNYDQLGDNQKAALNSLVFQLGSSGLAKFRNMLNYLAQGNSKAVENSLINSRLGQSQAPARARRTALMLAYDIPHEQADAILAQQGRISPQERKYQ